MRQGFTITAVCLLAASAGCPERRAAPGPGSSTSASPPGSTEICENAPTSVSTAPSQQPSGVAGAWSPAGELSSARAELSLVLLPNGDVLAIGGEASFSPSSTVDRFDPKSARWNKVASLETARHHHSSVLLADGRVLVAGGIGPQHARLSSVEIFDPKSNDWKAAAPLSSARSNHAATMLPSGQVLLVGGRDGNDQCTASCTLYDPAKDVWSAAVDLPHAVCDLSLLSRADVVLALGGASRDAVRGMLAYSIGSSSWSKRAAPTARRQAHAATLLTDGRVLISGGNAAGQGARLSSTEVYHPSRDQWQTAAALSRPRVAHSVTLLADGRLLVSGGRDEDNLATTQILNVDENRWQPGPAMPAARSAHRAVRLSDGRVLVAGGYLGTGQQVAPTKHTAIFRSK